MADVNQLELPNNADMAVEVIPPDCQEMMIVQTQLQCKMPMQPQIDADPNISSIIWGPAGVEIAASANAAVY